MCIEKKIFFEQLSVPLEIADLVIRPYCNTDIDELYELYSSKSVMECINLEAMTSLKDMVEYIELSKENIRKEYKYELTIEHITQKKVIGVIVVKFKKFNENIIELGYLLNEGYWGEGIMTKCVDAITSLVHRLSNVIRIHALCEKDNIASQQVLKKNNYELVGSVLKYDIDYLVYEYHGI